MVPAALAALFLVVPLVALVLETPWRDLWTLVRTEEVLDALRLTVITSLATVVVCVVAGTPLAWVLARVPFRGRGLLRAAVVVPLVLPPVVAGVTLIAAFGRGRLIGGPLEDLTGYTIPFTTVAVVLAHSFVAMPFYVLAVEGAFRSSGAGLDTVAATLGAGRWTTFRRVTLPLVAPGVAAGAVLCWARALGEFGATITFAGNFPGTTQTMPLAVYLALQDEPEAAIALSLVLLVVSLATLLLLRDRWLGRSGAAL